jgi:hypothetical protein
MSRLGRAGTHTGKLNHLRTGTDVPSLRAVSAAPEVCIPLDLGRTLYRISLHRNEPGSHAMQDCAESLGFAASIVGVRHERQRRSIHGHEAGKDCQGFGNV